MRLTIIYNDLARSKDMIWETVKNLPGYVKLGNKKECIPRRQIIP